MRNECVSVIFACIVIIYSICKSVRSYCGGINFIKRLIQSSSALALILLLSRRQRELALHLVCISFRFAQLDNANRIK